MTTALNANDNANDVTLYMAMELSNKTWKLGFGDGTRQRLVNITSGDWLELHAQMGKAREKFGLRQETRVVSCYEAGRDGFWIHRALLKDGIENYVVDSASIEVNRRYRRAKSDGIDVKSLLRLLLRHAHGEDGVMRVVRVPTIEQEDRRRLHRERQRLIKERGGHSARIKSLLVAHGIRLKIRADFAAQLATVMSPGGYALGSDLKAELAREFERYQLAQQQIKELEAEQQERLCKPDSQALKQVAHLLLLRGIGHQSSWILAMEMFSWRQFKNRRELSSCAGLTPTPHSSGDSEREQGISKAGNVLVRSLMVELSWLWLRYQPHSELSQWYERRFAQGGKRMRRIGIVAMARKLLIALWRYVEDGVVPEGAVLKPA